MDPAAGPGRASAWLQWVFVALCLLYALLVHHGLGPILGARASAWWEPRNFFDDYGFLLPLLETTPRALIGFAVPALLLTAAVFLTGESAFARALALASVFATLLFTYYGLQSDIWTFFGWRGSAVMATMSLLLGLAAAAPFLARSWLRLGWPLRVVLYAPFCLVVVAFIRNATGTDPSLRFAISPWPAVPVFGLEVGALFLFVGFAGVAVGARGFAALRAGQAGIGRAVATAAAGVALPVAILAAGSALGLLPFQLGPRVAVFVAAACALGMGAVVAFQRGAGAEALRMRVHGIAVGAALVGIPLIGGQAWARLDYYVTREIRARQITDALAAHLEAEGLYPDELSELVPHYLKALPEPAIGFGFLYDGKFRYRSFGTSFLLEFPAPRWVECAYTPPYEDEDEEEPDDVEYSEEDEKWGMAPGEDDSLGEAWSCPSSPPELL